jgi:hypothetical protein
MLVMWWANLPSIFRIKKANSSLLNTFMKKYMTCGMVNLECAEPFTIHINDRSGKFEWIQYSAPINLKKEKWK